jgi:antitoxin (DNA-binding transcriptional repressor) of toxin-antitoxin stability system
MDLIAIKDLKSPRALRARLKEQGELVLTTSGKPVAILVNLPEGEDTEAALAAVRSARAQLALRRVREAARKAGTDRLALPQINRIIAGSRAARKHKA